MKRLHRQCAQSYCAFCFGIRCVCSFGLRKLSPRWKLPLGTRWATASLRIWVLSMVNGNQTLQRHYIPSVDLYKFKLFAWSPENRSAMQSMYVCLPLRWARERISCARASESNRIDESSARCTCVWYTWLTSRLTQLWIWLVVSELNADVTSPVARHIHSSHMEI